MTSQIIQSSLPRNALAYRLDGDQFGILVENTNSQELQNIYNNIKTKLSHQQFLEKSKIFVTFQQVAHFIHKMEINIKSYINIQIIRYNMLKKVEKIKQYFFLMIYQSINRVFQKYFVILEKVQKMDLKVLKFLSATGILQWN